MIWVLLLPFLLQGGLMAVDEFHFHRRRGLPRWEIVGHPLDTLTVILPFASLRLRPDLDTGLPPFIALAVFSCLFVTKDEFIHRERCAPAEQWLHSLLFLLHPTIFFCAGLLHWRYGQDGFLLGQLAVLGAFLLYQLLYWGPRWARAT